ncbi:MAG TPA: hypothetical protein VGE10_07780 [Zeimonas sp.]
MPAIPRPREEALHGARTYAGTYSCDGCVERRLTVTIFADGRYRLREVAGHGAPNQEHGRWSAAPTAPERLVLESAGGARVLRRTAPDELTIVDHEGRELHGLIGGVLLRLPDVDPLPEPERLVGTYHPTGTRRVLVDCASGNALPVLAGVGDSAQAALDQAWSELAPHDDESVLVVVHVHRVALDTGAAAAGREAIVVDAFERATRNARCGGPLSRLR